MISLFIVLKGGYMNFDDLVKKIVDCIHNLRIYVVSLYKLIKSKINDFIAYIIKSTKGKDKDKIKELN